VKAAPAHSSGIRRDRLRQLVSGRFTRYTSLSLITVPVGYGLLLLSRNIWDVNAGLLNLAVGTVLTPPSFLLYRRFVWHERAGKGLLPEMFAFWQLVMVGAIASGIFIAMADAWWGARGLTLVAAGLLGQAALFIGRYIWLDRVTFATPKT
jgi:putative flippase GtrA